MAHQFYPLRALLISNSKWVEGVLRFQPNFFKNSAYMRQTPRILWLGCADSRVPESVITLARPGDIFVHRNVANQLLADDTNFLSVLEYAVDELKVDHVIVVGHSRCGGAYASLQAVGRNEHLKRPIQTVTSHPVEAPINRWLAPLTELTATIDLPSEPSKALEILIDENVKTQVNNLSKTKTIQDAWSRARAPPQDQLPEHPLGSGRVWIHGLVYELESGYLRDLDVSQNWEL
ncbi:hypothetical protein HYPSUDRAFT_90833 [Hypholoma sublateritium FD-334 SS-4]|uniref:Carbonic anhydrase n=1 Tax=Hypholoma sublateritium (strain FD-334 SS-4) TaxID=945553 RepID=A0A0D2KRL6_HYPSF|nr:hypothetical protein HYPSUDRAFT_90833 [Hypholoma sublateritium FD-334 SS-4]